MISIVIPTKNRCEILMKVLPSYLNQKNVIEVIIVDDGSTDNTEKYVRKQIQNQNKIRYYKNANNKGLPASRNIGYKLAVGKYIYLGEDDLELTKGYLDTLLNHLIKNKVDIVAGRRIWVQAGETKVNAEHRTALLKGNPVNYKYFLSNFEIKLQEDTELPLLDACMLIRRNVFDSVRYDENLKGNFWREETDFQISAQEQGFKLLYCPHAASYHLPRNNKGGCHSSNTFVYHYWCIKNTYYFIKKHSAYLKKHLRLKSIMMYMINFIAYDVLYGLLFPWVIFQKKRIFNRRTLPS